MIIMKSVIMIMYKELHDDDCNDLHISIVKDNELMPPT